MKRMAKKALSLVLSASMLCGMYTPAVMAAEYSDVKDGDWFATHILRCYAAGILSGSNGMANPNTKITRQEAMSMLARALEIAPADASKLVGYPDNDSVAGWAAPHVAALVSGGIVGGMDDGTLAPAGAMSRAALMTVLNRAVVQYIQADGTYKLTDADGIILVAGAAMRKQETE